MSSVGAQGADHYVLARRGSAWFVLTPFEEELGPYFSASMTLEVATAHVLFARRAGHQAHAYVREPLGHLRHCTLVDRPAEHCARCQNPSGQQRRCLLQDGLRAPRPGC